MTSIEAEPGRVESEGESPLDSPWPASAFWDFAVRLYAEEGIEAACLRLQDEGGIDVLLFLLGGWLAACGRALDLEQGERLRACAQNWRCEVIAPLRHARRSLRHLADACSSAAMQREEVRRRVAAVELDAEHLAAIQLETLASAATPLPAASSSELLAANFAALGLRIAADLSDSCSLVLGVAVTKLGEGERRDT